MSDKDFIKDLFQEQLGNFEAPVNPDLWVGIQSQIGNVAASSTTASSAAVAGKSSLVTKIAVAASIATAGGVGTYYFTKEDPSINQEKVLAVNEENSPAESTEEIKEESIEFNAPSAESLEIELLPPPITPIIDDSELEDLDDLTTSSTGPSTSYARDHASSGINIGATDARSGGEVHGSSSTGNSGEAKSSTGEKENESTELVANITVDRQGNQHYRFSAESNSAHAQYIWDFGDGNTSRQQHADHFYSTGGNYKISLTVIDGERATTRYTDLDVKVLGKFTLLPEAFTPNNDGINDEFFVESKNIEEFTIIIMNNKNEIVYQSDDKNFRWDGVDRRTALRVEEGVYYYMISARDESGNNINEHNRLEVSYTKRY